MRLHRSQVSGANPHLSSPFVGEGSDCPTALRAEGLA